MSALVNAPAAVFVASSFADPQAWIVTAIAIAAVFILARCAIGPRKKSGCGSCAPTKSSVKPPAPIDPSR